MTSTLKVLTTSDRRHALVTLTASGLANDAVWRARVFADLGAASTAFVSGPRAWILLPCKEPYLETAAKARARRWTAQEEIYTPAGLQDLIQRENGGTLRDLVAQIRSPMGIVPFVGAGMSKELQFPGWGEFLNDAAELHTDPGAVRRLIEKGAFEDAASMLWRGDPDGFQRGVARTFNRPLVAEEVREATVSALPMLAPGPVITTNFDHVLETAFKLSGAPFDGIISGPQPDHVVRAMHRNEHVLLKLHGDADDRTSRIFTGAEYKRGYDDGGSDQPTIPSLGWLMFTNRPLLFVGASLDRDRTLAVLQEIHAKLPGLVHYAIVESSYVVGRFRERRQRMSGLGISPLWFPPGEFGAIRTLLELVLQEASSHILRQAPIASLTPEPKAPAAIEPLLRLGKTSNGHSSSSIPRPVVSRIARKAVGNGLVYFLGAYAHLSVQPLFENLAHSFDADQSGLERAQIAAAIAVSEGRREIWIEAKRNLEALPAQPSLVYRFLAALPAYLRARGYEDSCWQWILTTNYDTMLERVFHDAGEPFHLLYYQADGPDEGRFLHRSPDGSIRVIDRPDNIHTFRGPAHVLVKLDGGIAWDPLFIESVAIIPSDYNASAGRFPGALPLALRSALQDRSLLVMGSSLKDPHVERLIRWSAESSIRKSWAVVKPMTHGTGWINYWSSVGLQMIQSDLQEFVLALLEEFM